LSPSRGGGNELLEGFRDRKTICAFRKGQQKVPAGLLTGGAHADEQLPNASEHLPAMSWRVCQQVFAGGSGALDR
jgi:hypothetical protein